MKQMSVERYSIAWFKLADCVARGEKERALGMYRLLAHGLEDKAFATQLMGDILLSFDDVAAAEKYQEAAALYLKEHRVAQAAAVYEHLALLNERSVAYLEKLVELYRQLGCAPKVVLYGKKLFAHLAQLEQMESVEQLLADLKKSTDSLAEHAALHADVLFAYLSKKPLNKEYADKHLRAALDGFVLTAESDRLMQLMARLSATHADLHTQACEYLEMAQK